MDTQHNSTPESAFNVKGIKALGYITGSLPRKMFPGLDDGALGELQNTLEEQAMRVSCAALGDLEWKLNNLATEVSLIDGAATGDWHPEMRAWADLLRADILRLIGTEQTDPAAPVLDAFRAWATICRQHRAKFQAEDVPDDVADRMCDERRRLWGELMALPAVTAAGMAAKAYAAADFSGDGIEAPEDDDHTYEAETARAIIADAKRLLPSDLLRGMAS